MIYQIISLNLYIPKIYFNAIWAFTFEIIPFVWIQAMIEKVLKHIMTIIDYNNR